MKKILKVAIVGMGQAGLRHLSSFSKPKNVQIEGVADPDKKILKDINTEYGFNTYPSYRKLLDLDLDILVIATPHRFLYQIGMDAAEAGVDILIEKPISLNSKDALRLVNHCDAKKVKMGVSFVHRYRREVLKTKEWISSNNLGKLLLTQTTLIFPQRDPLPKWLNSPKDSGGGIIMYGAIHSIDMLCWLIEDVCVSVTAKCGSNSSKDKVENYASCIFQFSKGTCSTMAASTNIAVTKGHTWKTNLIFQNGMITLFIKKYAKYISFDKEIHYKSPAGEDINYNFKDQASDYVDRIIKGVNPSISGIDAVNSMKIVDAIYESSETCSMVNIKN